MVSRHRKSPFLQRLRGDLDYSRIGNPGKENLPGTCRRAHGQFEAFFPSFPEAGGWKSCSPDVARLREGGSATPSTNTPPQEPSKNAVGHAQQAELFRTKR